MAGTCAARRPLARVHWRFPERAVRLSRAADGRARGGRAGPRRCAADRTAPRSRWLAASCPTSRRRGGSVCCPEVEDVFVFPHMGDGGLALGAAVAAAAALGEPFASISVASISARPSIGRSSKRAFGRQACRRRRRQPAVPGRRAAGRQPDRHVVPGSAWSTARVRSGTAACWRGPIGSMCAIASIWRSSGASGISRSAPACSRARRARLLADWTGGRNRAMTMAYQVAEEYRAHLAGVISVDGTCRPQLVADDDRTIRGPAARGAPAVGRRRRAQHELQHSRRAAGVLA